MAKVISPVTFVACGAVQSFRIPVTGNYVLTAVGAQGGAGAAPGGKGASVQGVFYLRENETIQIVVGMHGGPGLTFGPERAACGGGGGGATVIWKLTAGGAKPMWPLLVAAGGGGGGCETGGEGRAGDDCLLRNVDEVTAASGHGGITDPCRHFGGGGGAGWFSPGANGPGPIFCCGGAHWQGGKGTSYGPMAGGDGGFGGGGGGGFLGYASGGGGGFGGGFGGGQEECQLERVTRSSGGTSYNAGRHQTNLSGAQGGHGYASLVPVTASVILHTAPLVRFESPRLIANISSVPRVTGQ